MLVFETHLRLDREDAARLERRRLQTADIMDLEQRMWTLERAS